MASPTPCPSYLLPPLRRPLLGTLIDARQQVLLLATHALSSPAAANRYLYSHLALTSHDVLEGVNDWLQDGEWGGAVGVGLGVEREELRAGCVRRLEFELFQIRRYVTSDTSISADTLRQLWAFYDVMRHFSARNLHVLLSLPETLALSLISSLPDGTALDPQTTPASLLRGMIHTSLTHPPLLALAVQKQITISVRGLDNSACGFAGCETGETELGNGDAKEGMEMETMLRRLGLGALVSGGNGKAKADKQPDAWADGRADARRRSLELGRVVGDLLVGL